MQLVEVLFQWNKKYFYWSLIAVHIWNSEILFEYYNSDYSSDLIIIIDELIIFLEINGNKLTPIQWFYISI